MVFSTLLLHATPLTATNPLVDVPGLKVAWTSNRHALDGETERDRYEELFAVVGHPSEEHSKA